MATLALAAVGAAVGSAVLPAGLTVLGTTLTGAAIGTQIGTLAGSFVDQALFGTSGGRDFEGPRLDELRVMGASEGAPIPRIYGAARVGGQVIWAEPFEEEVTTEEVGGGGKGGLGGGGGAEQTTYTYYATFAVAICEGEIGGIGRIWADGQPFDQSTIAMRVYSGTEDQAPDPAISAAQEDGHAPAFRGVAYVVFERLPLAEFGNRLPQLSFETFRPVDDFQAKLKGVVMIPGSGEFVYGTTPITRTGADGTQVAENANTTAAATDMLASLDQLEAVLPNVKRASLVVSWFGDDLRAGTCQVRPAVDRTDKPTSPETWRVAGVSRGDAHVVSAVDGVASYGGTPSDAVIVEAIQECQRRGIGVTLTPFILMDIPADNALDNPYAPGSTQPPHPWRGRMTVSAAPGVVGSPDQTAAAAAEIATFVGTASVSDFSISGQAVTYSGPNEWTLRRQILHYAHLAKAAGGVDAFLLSSELRGLTQVRQSRDAFPFVDALVQLAADVRSVLGPATKITYAADWSEYFGYQPTDGSGDVLFHLDPLWASPAVDAIGIDLYWPLSDWRDGTTHADAATAATPYDRAYLV
ncbi:MAG: glycoside hydrolase TIM-barrel-like domain-containing protein, partial [Pseudomonadota bacterium]